MPPASTVITAAGVTAAVGVIGYAIWFDQKRRNDAEFRRQLKKDRKKIDRSTKLAASESESTAPTHDFEGALEQIRKEPVASSPAESERFFLENVSTAESLIAKGPLFHFPAAVAFYRALRMYPAPTELLGLYQQTVAPPVFMLIVELMNHDVSQELSSVRGGAIEEDGIDDDIIPASRSASRHGPPSETSSHEWDKLSDPGPPSVA